jgi:membrane-associated HD superfamily phosphohydrolase
MTSLNGKLRDFFVQPTSVYAKPIARRIVLGLAFFFLFMIILSTEFISDKVFFEVGQVSDRDVISPKTVAYVDLAKTKKLEMEVLASVLDVYDLDASIIVKAEGSIEGIFKAARMVALDKTITSSTQKVEKIRQFSPVPLTDTVIDALTTLDEKSLSNAEDQTKTIVRKYFQRGIRDDDLEMAKKNIGLETEELGLGKDPQTVVIGIAQALLQPNFVLNARETDKRKQLAVSNIEPIREIVKKG